MKPIFTYIALPFLCGLSAAAEDDPFDKLAAQLTGSIPKSTQPVNLCVGNFVYGDTAMMSQLSTVIREELENKLSSSDKVQIITRSNLDQLETEGEFQATDWVEPGTAIGKVTVLGVEGIVRGRFICDGKTVTLYTEIAWLKGGRVTKGKTTWKLNEVAAKVWPEKSTTQAEALVEPQNMEDSSATIEEVSNSKLLTIKQDIPLQLKTGSGERAFAEGEIIEFRVRSAKACHIAVICHQSDGTSVVLFPNKWHRDTLIPADRWINIPGTLKSGFEIEAAEPFGSDVVQVIACTNENALHQEIKGLASAATEDEPYPVTTRGMIVKKVKAAAKADVGKETLWGEKHIVVSTFPKE